MKIVLSKLDLEQIKDFARKEMQESIKLSHESEDSYHAKCWSKGFEIVLNKKIRLNGKPEEEIFIFYEK
jgi:hypothetical protein